MSEQETSTFEFAGGYLCLDFANTLTDRPSAAPVEQLNAYSDLLAWSQQAGILENSEAAQLLALAKSQPEEATRRLDSIKQARELIYLIFSTTARGQVPDAEVIQQFNRALAETMIHACLAPSETGSGWRWTWTGEQDKLECPLWFIIRSAADLLTSPELNCVRICASEDCAWLFLDTSKNHSRRWCDMKSCGNRAKARRLRAQKKVREQ
jgi:predicted RNA-binding Zn ribbon-like protein